VRNLLPECMLFFLPGDGGGYDAHGQSKVKVDTFPEKKKKHVQMPLDLKKIPCRHSSVFNIIIEASTYPSLHTCGVDISRRSLTSRKKWDYLGPPPGRWDYLGTSRLTEEGWGIKRLWAVDGASLVYRCCYLSSYRGVFFPRPLAQPTQGMNIYTLTWPRDKGGDVGGISDNVLIPAVIKVEVISGMYVCI